MEISIVPVGKPRQTQSDRWKQRPVVVRYRAFCDELRLKLPGYRVPEGLVITFYLPMPLSWSNKKRVREDGKPHKQRPDIDNLVKSFLDALCEDDSYVWRVEAQKYWSVSGAIEVGCARNV